MNQRITFFWWFAAKPPALFYLLFKGEPCAAHCTYFNIIPFAVNAWGNTAIDSLRKLGHTARHDTTRINAFILAGENFYPDYPDSCTIYWEKAIQLCDKALKKHGGKTKTRLLVLKAAAINNIAIIYTFSGQTQLALDWNFKALKIREAAKNDHGMAESYNNIASVYTDLGDTASALTFLKKSRVYYTKINDWGGVAYNCLNMSKIYSAQKRDDLALELLEESKKILEKKPHLKSALANCLNFIGSIYKREGKEKEAKNYLLTALKIRLAIDDHSGIANSYVTLSDFYTETNKPDSAFYCAKQGMEYAQKSRNPETISRSAFTYSNALKARRNFEESLTYYDLYIRMRDSVNNGKTQKAMVKNQFKYQYENKAATDSLKHAEENIIKEERLAREKFQNIVLYIGLAVLILFIIYGYSRFKIIRQQKATIEQQKQIVDVKNKEMLDSMHYAKEIQNALLPSANMLNEMFAEHFILFKPKDIVSGDFYWSAKRGDEFYLAVCDSTGHGVPGAFMSLLNISFLNEAVIEKEMGKPSDALNYIRKRLIENVSRNGGQDGMDGTLAHFDRKNMKLRYASAHNKPLLIRKGEAQELPADKMPIGKGVIRQSFTQHEVDLQTGDIVYFYSDGYADQFGGPKGKKFKSSNLNSLLVRVSKFSLSEQNAKLEEQFETWKGEFEQLDDVCVIGVKL